LLLLSNETFINQRNLLVDMVKKVNLMLILVIFLIPALIGYLNRDMVFSGLSATDGNTYLSFMNQAREGKVLFTNMYTSEEIPYIMFRPTYLVAGWFSFVTKLPNIVVYHLLRLIGIVLFIFFLEKIISLYFKNEKERFITLLICIFASGIGFFFKFLTLFGVKQYGSIDLWVTDANNFLILMSHPHTIFSVAFIVASIYYFLKWNKSFKIKNIIFSALFAFILGFEHLFDVITIYLVIGLFMADQFISQKKIDWKKIKHLMLFVFITALPFIYTYIMFTTFPSFSSWNAQNVLDTPKLLHVIFGYGFMFFSFIAVLWYSIANHKKIKPETKYALYWIISVLILIYSPFNIQRRFFEGAHIPFGIITGIFLFKTLKPYLNLKFNKRTAAAIIIFILILVLPTNIYHLFNRTLNLDNGRGIFPYSVNNYIYPEEQEALLWLKDNTEPNSVIISAYNIGNYIPRYMNQRVYLGHWAQTIYFEQKSKDIENYFKENKNINLNKQAYVWYGVDEKTLNPNFQPIGSELVFENEKVKIYRLK